ncbi:ABC transporter permease [Desulfosporosinus sp. OT]|uniref:ABC transporter permease n=1 Tax=Desulfosporosinus sp. OT TaxID=913865 RepID=UPI000223AF2D|nr:ABC transporter permease [Desulfosporosinus sp. OT]EGW38865.1 ABC-2 type transporter family protein [Desulfosporosinus sp. OT]
MNALISQWKADLIRTSRDKRFFILTLVMPVLLYLLFSNKTSGSPAQNAYTMVAMAVFGVITSSVNTLSVRLAAERQSGWTTFLRTTPLSSVTYTLGKALTQLVLTLATILVVFAVGCFFKGVNLPIQTWIFEILWLCIASIPFAMLGILIGMTGSSAQILGALAYLILALLGGLFGKPTGMLQDFDKWLPTHYFAQPGWDMLQGKTPDIVTDVAVLTGYAIIFIAISAILQRHSNFAEGFSFKKFWQKYKRFIIIGLIILWVIFRRFIFSKS